MQAPPVIARRMFPYWWLLLVVPAAIAACLLLFYFNPTQYAFYPRCTLYTLTGIYCPGCGCLRAIHQLSHGQVLSALHDNLLLVAGLILLGVDGAQFLYRRMNSGSAQLWVMRPMVIKCGIAVIILFAVLRNIHASPFNWLAPI